MPPANKENPSVTPAPVQLSDSELPADPSVDQSAVSDVPSTSTPASNQPLTSSSVSASSSAETDNLSSSAPPAGPAVITPGVALGLGGVPPTDSTTASAPQPRRRKRKLVVFLVIVLVLALLAGGVAAAYYAVVVPNRPENVLKTAVENSMRLKTATYDGKFEYDMQESEMSIDMAMKGGVDARAKTMEFTLRTTVNGVTVPVEARLVGGSIFVRVSELDRVTGLLEAMQPDASSTFERAARVVNGKWIEVDRTLLERGKINCVLDESWKEPSQAEIDMIVRHYERHPFATIQNTRDEEVDGKNALRYQLQINDKRAFDYMESLIKELPSVKKLSECFGEDETDQIERRVENQVDPKDRTNMTLWVDKESKQIVRVASSLEEPRGGISGSFDMKFKPNARVSVSKPDGAVPLLTVVTQVLNEINPGQNNQDVACQALGICPAEETHGGAHTNSIPL